MLTLAQNSFHSLTSSGERVNGVAGGVVACGVATACGDGEPEHPRSVAVGELVEAAINAGGRLVDDDEERGSLICQDFFVVSSSDIVDRRGDKSTLLYFDRY
jgi:hypothetical protein